MRSLQNYKNWAASGTTAAGLAKCTRPQLVQGRMQIWDRWAAKGNPLKTPWHCRC